LFDVFCEILGLFAKHLTLIGYILTSPSTPIWCYSRGARKEQKLGSVQDHGSTVVLATNHGERWNHCLFIFLRLCGWKHPKFSI